MRTTVTKATRKTLLGVIADEAELLKMRCNPFGMEANREFGVIDLNALRHTYEWLGRYIDGLTTGNIDEIIDITLNEPND